LGFISPTIQERPEVIASCVTPHHPLEAFRLEDVGMVDHLEVVEDLP
jgi:hypothetical protein